MPPCFVQLPPALTRLLAAAVSARPLGLPAALPPLVLSAVRCCVPYPPHHLTAAIPPPFRCNLPLPLAPSPAPRPPPYPSLQVSDVADVVRQRADGLVLCGETAAGLYPLKSLEVLRGVATRIEEWTR